LEQNRKICKASGKKIWEKSVITGVCGSNEHIKNWVNIPKWWYKILFLPNGKTIGFLVPNTNNKMSRAKAKEFLVDKKEIEKRCGVRFVNFTKYTWQ